MDINARNAKGTKIRDNEGGRGGEWELRHGKRNKEMGWNGKERKKEWLTYWQLRDLSHTDPDLRGCQPRTVCSTRRRWAGGSAARGKGCSWRMI